MIREEFLQIYRMLIMNDPDKQIIQKSERYELLKFTIIRNSQISYLPDKEMSIDESLIDWKGRLDIKVFIPSKRSRYGLKSYMLSESKTNYVYNWSLHTSEETIEEIVYPL